MPDRFQENFIFKNPLSYVALCLNSLWALTFIGLSLLLAVGSILALMQAVAVVSIPIIGVWAGVLLASLTHALWVFWTLHERFKCWNSYKNPEQEFFDSKPCPFQPDVIISLSKTKPYTSQSHVTINSIKAQIAFWILFMSSAVLIITGFSLGTVSVQHVWIVHLLSHALGVSPIDSLFTLLAVAMSAAVVYVLLTHKASLFYEDEELQYNGFFEIVGSILKQIMHLSFITLCIGYGTYGVFSLLSTTLIVGALFAYLAMALTGIGFFLITSIPWIQLFSTYQSHKSSMKLSFILMFSALVLSLLAWSLAAPLFTPPLIVMLSLAMVVSLLGSLMGLQSLFRKHKKRSSYYLISNNDNASDNNNNLFDNNGNPFHPHSLTFTPWQAHFILIAFFQEVYKKEKSDYLWRKC